MTKLILVKHSLPVVVPNMPSALWHLGAEGIERCRGLAHALTAYGPFVLVSSSEPKACETAAYLASYWSIPWTPVAGLEEQYRRTAPFLGTELFHQTMQRFFAYPTDLVFGEETAEAAYTRFSTALDALLMHDISQSLLVVTHGTVMSLYLSRRAQIEPFTMWTQLGLPSWVIVDRETSAIESAMMRIPQGSSG